MENKPNSVPISIIIPTYGREQVLIETIESLRELQTMPAEIIVVDQSESHQADVEGRLTGWVEDGSIRWIKLSSPSIPHAMNTGLLNQTQQTALFVDDDIKAHEHLLEAHYSAHQQSQFLIVAGRVIQPWDENQKLTDSGHQFNSSERKYIDHFMGGNFSVNKSEAIKLGGFDENFVGVAYRFESDFADRWLSAGHKILFEPAAAVDHLKVAAGGTREYGEHLTTAQPYHAVGAHYYLLISKKFSNKTSAVLLRFIQSIKTRHHLKHPWYIPLTLLAELRGLLMALRLSRAGPKYIRVGDK